MSQNTESCPDCLSKKIINITYLLKINIKNKIFVENCKLSNNIVNQNK